MMKPNNASPKTLALVRRLIPALMVKNYVKIILLGVAILVSVMASADGSISGRVVGVADGDTLTVLDDTNQQHKIRLAGIDAPEKAQPFGQVGKQRLSELCYNKQATVEVVNTDRYGRTVGDVTCDGVHANAEMVSGGNAWVYRHYDKGFESFYALEEAAKEARLGLWADDNPTPPWEWRHSRKLKD
jgi:endonuclease YncB( thermonuclease family)